MPNTIDSGGFPDRGGPALLPPTAGFQVKPFEPTVVDIRCNGVSYLSITRAGALTVPATTFTLGAGATITCASFLILGPGTGIVVGSTAFSDRIGFTSNTMCIQSVLLTTDGADIFAQRRTTNAQTCRIYGTYTNASDYVRASLATTSTTVTLAAETAGTGADNVPVVLTPAGTAQIEIGNGVQFTEMTAPSAPAANKVILFAQDNGAGKTQLMALFASGAAQQVAIEP